MPVVAPKNNMILRGHTVIISLWIWISSSTQKQSAIVKPGIASNNGSCLEMHDLAATFISAPHIGVTVQEEVKDFYVTCLDDGPEQYVRSSGCDSLASISLEQRLKHANVKARNCIKEFLDLASGRHHATTPRG